MEYVYRGNPFFIKTDRLYTETIDKLELEFEYIMKKLETGGQITHLLSLDGGGIRGLVLTTVRRIHYNFLTQIMCKLQKKVLSLDRLAWK